ncbi:MAG: 16S rRNA (cytidine(1402)-2'-O)-methyltransferase [Candidatus Zixiibacteriota bacterium]
MSRPGVLYVVATPLGNLDDISTRAVHVLGSVDLILCEDTRRTRVLVYHLGIRIPTLSLHEHNERSRTAAVLARLGDGARIALVSDAGTPVISDPGYRLIASVVESGHPIVPIPGASAVTALLSVAGLPADRYVFEGFLPPKSGRRARRLAELAAETRTIVLFESPHRLARTLGELHAAWGDRWCCVGRELTKRYEEIQHGRLSELAARHHSRAIKGEITLAVAGADEKLSAAGGESED